MTGVTHAVLPAWVLALMQVVIGSVVGSRLVGIHWRKARNTLALAAVWAIMMVLIAAIAATAGAWLLGRSFDSMLLALTPGGMMELNIITLALGIEVAFVVTCQVSRILLVLAIMPLAYRLFMGPVRSGGTPSQD